MFFIPTQYGTPEHPVQEQDLAALTSCSLAWKYQQENRENETTNVTKANTLLEKSARETISLLLQEGVWDGDEADTIFRQRYRYLAQNQRINWEGRDPRQEGRAYLEILRSFLKTARRKVKHVIASNQPFEFALDDIYCQGTIDLLYENEDDKLCLSRFNFSKKRPSRWLIDNDAVLRMHATALVEGVFGAPELCRWPDQLEWVQLHDWLPIKKGSRVKIEHPEQSEHFGAPLWTSITVTESNTFGPGFYQSKQRPEMTSRFAFSLKQFKNAVQEDRLVETFGEHCRSCPYQTPCRAEGSDLLGPHERARLERSMESIASYEIQP
jgi:hypothetical protein